MIIERTGHILYVNQYEKCNTFYANVLGLKILFKNDVLTTYNFFGTYLMVEKEDRDTYIRIEEGQARNFSCIRMNVRNVQETAAFIRAKGIDIDYQKYHWGEVAKFKDPDGNLIAFKDEKGFAKQIEEYQNQ